MRHLLRPLAIGTFGLAFAIAPAFALQQQDPSKTSADSQTTQSSATAQPCQTTAPSTQPATSSTSSTPTTPPAQSTSPTQTSPASTTAAQPCAQTTAQPKLQPGDPGYNAPVAQKADPNVKAGSKQDVEAIGNRADRFHLADLESPELAVTAHQPAGVPTFRFEFALELLSVMGELQEAGRCRARPQLPQPDGGRAQRRTDPPILRRESGSQTLG